MDAQAYAQLAESGEHPAWCARQHHCTATLGGSHASEPEVWRTEMGRLISTRYEAAGVGHVEIRLVVPLPPDEDPWIADHLRGLLGGVWGVLRRFRWF